MIDLLSGIQSTASALTAERVRMDVISGNIANANTTRGPDGKPYQRQQVVFESVLAQHDGSGGLAQPIQIARIEKDSRPPLMLSKPGHPDADKDGMVAVPDISIHQEMADLMVASRGFEANLAVVKTARMMAMQTLAIGKRS